MLPCLLLETHESAIDGDEEVHGNPAGPEAENEVLSYEEASLHSSTESGKNAARYKLLVLLKILIVSFNECNI